MLNKNKKIRIAIVSKLWEETSPKSRGGTGSSIGLLVDELVARGHQVTLFATANSRTKAQKMISVRGSHYQGDYSETHEYENIANAFRRADSFDIIHCAVEQKSVFFGDLVDTPSLHSIRYGEFFDHELKLLKNYRNLNYVTNSIALKKKLPFLNWQGVVHNGLNLDDFTRQEKAGDYLLYLDRLSPQKGIDLAIQAAIKTKKKLIIAGRISTTDAEFLEKKVYPFIDNKLIEYQGEVLGEKKKKLIAGAYCLLHPNSIFEACSNTILESLASNIPVIAFDRGSNSELIRNAETGFIVNNLSEMINSIKKIHKIDRSACSLSLQKTFSIGIMTDSYEDIYYSLINKNK